jgi:6-phosphogluconolactonase
LGKIELAIEAVRPNYFAMHPKLPVMYTVNEGSGPAAGVSGFTVDAASGGLTLINEVSSHGDGPCYVSVGVGGREAFVANYSGGSVACFPVGVGGRLQEALLAQPYVLTKPGPVADRQNASHMHCVTISPDGKFVLACDLGADVIRIFRIGMKEGDRGDGPVLHPSSVFMQADGEVAARAGSGPRHVAFHPNGKWVYCVHELDCTIDLYDWKVRGQMHVLTLREDSVVSTLAKGVALQGNTGCEVVVSDDGRFLYTCTRGVDEIVVYRVDAGTGLLTELQRLGCGGKVPRILAFDPSRKWMVSCNQGGDGTVGVFACDARTGMLTMVKVYAAETPMFAMWV